MKEKKSIQAKIVKHAHRRRFQDYVRTKGREKSTIAYVYWSMYLRSGKGNMFVLDEELFLSDLGISVKSLRPARKELFDDGWLSKCKQAFNPETGQWTRVRWVVNEEAVVRSKDGGTAATLTDDRSTDGASTDDRSGDDTVVLHSLYADASTLDCTPSASTSSEAKKEKKGQTASLADAREAEAPALASLENPSGFGDPADQDQNPKDPWYDQPMEAKVEWCGLPVIKAIEKLWYETTSLDDVYNHRELVCHMIYEDAVDTVEYMTLALSECPQTCGVKWRDFPFFAKQWKDVTLPNVIAWERKRRAKMKEKADLSKYGACLLCEYRPAASAAGAYSSQHCIQCASAWSRAESIRDRCMNNSMQWGYEGSDYVWLGTENEEVFTYKKGAEYTTNTKALMNNKRAMDRLEALLDKQTVGATA